MTICTWQFSYELNDYDFDDDGGGGGDGGGGDDDGDMMAQEELVRGWNKSPTNGTITEESDYENDEGETVYPDSQAVYRDRQAVYRDRHVDYDDVSQDNVDAATFRDYDDVDQIAAVMIQSNYRGYRTRKHLSDSQY